MTRGTVHICRMFQRSTADLYIVQRWAIQRNAPLAAAHAQEQSARDYQRMWALLSRLIDGPYYGPSIADQVRKLTK